MLASYKAFIAATARQLQWVLVRTSPPKVIWEERIALAQLRNKFLIGYNGTPHIYPQNCPLPSTITTGI